MNSAASAYIPFLGALRCNKCKNRNRVDARYCVYCGHLLRSNISYLYNYNLYVFRMRIQLIRRYVYVYDNNRKIIFYAERDLFGSDPNIRIYLNKKKEQLSLMLTVCKYGKNDHTYEIFDLDKEEVLGYVGLEGFLKNNWLIFNAMNWKVGYLAQKGTVILKAANEVNIAEYRKWKYRNIVLNIFDPHTIIDRRIMMAIGVLLAFGIIIPLDKRVRRTLRSVIWQAVSNCIPFSTKE